MSGTIYTWIGLPGTAIPGNNTADWSVGGASPAGPPGPGDSAIVNQGTIILDNGGLQSNTIYLGGGELDFYGDTGTSPGFINQSTSGNNPSPSLDNGSVITTNVTGVEATPTSPQTAVLNLYGNFVNFGKIVANGVAGSSLTIAIAGTDIGTTTVGTATVPVYYPGYAINYNDIEVDAGNTMTITVAGTSELLNAGQIQVKGGSLLIDVAAGAIAGGYGPIDGAAIISGGGTLETNAAYAATVSGVAPTYAFVDTTAGNTLKIDNIGSFGGQILGFGTNDIIDLGTSLAVGILAYSSATGILKLENTGGTVLASVQFATGNFTNGTAALSGGSALGFTISTGGDGNTQITTAVQNDSSTNISGTWQTGSVWTNGTPGSLDTAIIGANNKTAFTLTTGSTAVAVGALVMAGDHDLLQITSNTTAGAYGIDQFGGSLEVTSGNTLTAPELHMTGGSLAIDAAAAVNLTGHAVTNLAANNGTIGIVSGSTLGVDMADGTLLVNGGTLNAGSAGAFIEIGYDGSGTSASVTVQNSGTNVGKVTAAYTDLASDPTSFGALTLSGTNATWTDTTYMLVGSNDQVGNYGTVTPPGYANAATLAVMQGATLTDTTYANIGATTDSAGTATVESGGLWAIGNTGLAVGYQGAGTLSVLSGGSVTVGSGGIGIGAALQTASGTLLVSGATSLLSINGGINDGKTGQGLLEIQNGGTVKLTGVNGITAGASAGSSGTILVGGTDSATGASALLNYAASAKGMTVGGAGAGTLTVSSGGTIQMNGTGGIVAGQSLAGSGAISVTGFGALLDDASTTKGIAVGQAGTGTLQVTSGGAVTIEAQGLTIGSTSSGHGTVTVSGTGSAITTGGTNGNITVGDSGTGSLDVSNGGVINAGTNTITIGNSVSGDGTVTVGGNGATINAGTLFIDNLGTVASVLTLNTGGTVGGLTNLTIGTHGTLNMAGGTLSASIPAQNNGLITGFGTVNVNATNSGTIAASGGLLVIVSGEGGTGFDTIGNGATLEEGSSLGSGQSVSFANGATSSALQLDQVSATQNFGLSNWQAGDKLIIANGATVTSAAMVNGNTLAVQTSFGEYDFTNVALAAGTSPAFATTSNSVELICFCAGTLIGTPSGEVPVQSLKAGDIVLTAHNGPRAVTWVGQGKVLSTRGKRTAATPVIVRKGALADNLPARDLHVTKAHSLYIDGVLIPVEFLVNHKTIIWDDRAQEVEIYHIELESHDILIANGAPAESYRDDGNRWLFQNANSGWHLPPQDPYAPVLTGGPVVDAIWQRLLDRAGPRSLPPMTDDPDVHLIVDGKRVDPVGRKDQVLVFHLSGQPETVLIASREGVPSELGIARDPRSLGVALRCIAVRQGSKFEAIFAWDTRLTDGFHPYETDGDIRWTDGYARLPATAFARFQGEVEVVLTLAGATQYPLIGDDRAQVAA